MAKAAANGITLEYESFGDPKNPTVLLINGLGSQMTRWPEAFCTLLAHRGMRAVRFDNRDVGLSTWLPADSAYGTEDMAADFPDRTLSLTSIMSATGNPDLPQPTAAAWAVISQTPPDPRADLDVFLDHQVRNAETIGSPAYPWPPGGLRERALAEYRRAYNPPGVAQQMAAIRASGDRRPKVRTITAPTVVLHGADDPLVPVEGGRDTAASIAGAELRVIPGMGHDLPPSLHPIFVDAIMAAVVRAGAPTPA